MKVHLIAIEICVVCVAVCVVHANSLLLWQNSCNVGHNTRLMKGGLSINKKNITVVHVSIDNLSSDS
jgi:hypothetical protein